MKDTICPSPEGRGNGSYSAEKQLHYRKKLITAFQILDLFRSTLGPRKNQPCPVLSILHPGKEMGARVLDPCAGGAPPEPSAQRIPVFGGRGLFSINTVLNEYSRKVYSQILFNYLT